jgi:penicillin-binding protein 1A
MRRPPSHRPRWLRRRSLAILFVVAAGIGATTGYLIASVPTPDLGRMLAYRPQITTVLYDRSGRPMEQFALERRQLVSFKEIAPNLRDAVIAMEDDRFFRHWGLDASGMLRALIHDLRSFRFKEGGSTITQQLAGNLFTGREKRLTRKLKEAIYALQIERRFTKEEIFEIYANQIFLGGNIYGFAEAANFFFAKQVSQLSLPEGAFLAGLIHLPNSYLPLTSPGKAARARARRNLVLDKMARLGMVTRDQAAAAKATPIRIVERSRERALAPFFAEQVRQFLEDRYGAQDLYGGGLRVYTTLDTAMQQAANQAVEDGLHQVDKRRGFRRSAVHNLVDDGIDPEAYSHPDWKIRPEVGDRLHALVLEVHKDRALLRLGRYRAELAAKDAKWARKSLPERLRASDVILIQVLALDSETGTMQVALDQEPEIEGALLALDVRSGAVRAMVGGYDFARSKFNRAVQARRQAGSAFKPFVYAAAIDNGFTAADVLFDEPFSWTDPSTGRVYAPENYHKEYLGLVTLRNALEFSRNIPAVKLLMRVGPELVMRYARRFGITAPLFPYPSLALGSAEVTLEEMISAYSAFPNGGVRAQPYLVERITDADGKELYAHLPQEQETVPADTAYVMVHMLRGVIERGTAATRARVLERPLAGKTGTTDDYADSWFLGFSPSLACGTWVGFDQKRSLGQEETGAAAALPVWVAFMKKALEGMPPEEFPVPPGVEFRAIDRRTGLRATPLCQGYMINEAFLRGTEPVTDCGVDAHLVLLQPYSMQPRAFPSSASTWRQ